MRIFLKIEIPVEAGNEASKKGRLGEIIQSILEEQHPEAAYFLDMDGNRTALIFLNITEPSEIPAIAEPWFLALKAKVELHPVMNAEDLAIAEPAIEKAARKFGD